MQELLTAIPWTLKDTVLARRSIERLVVMTLGKRRLISYELFKDSNTGLIRVCVKHKGGRNENCNKAGI